MSVTPRDYGLPWDEWRDSQYDALCRIMASPAKIVLLEAAPGIGKTGIAVALARALDQPQAVFLTGTKQLMDQYAELPGLVQVRGRNNFPCLLDQSITADQAACTTGAHCAYGAKNGLQGCPYWDTKRLAFSADEVVTNYPYHMLQSPYDWITPKLLVCDEAHQVRQQLESVVSATLRISHFESLGEKAPKFGEDVTKIILWAMGNYKVYGDMRNEIMSHKRAANEVTRAERRAHAAIFALASISYSLATKPDNWVVSQTTWGWELKPIWVTDYLKPYLKNTELAVFMSATILDQDLFCESLGLDTDSVEFIRYGSPFPVENRPLYYWPVAKVSGRDPSSYQKIVTAVDLLLERHPNEKGLIHTVNYALAQTILRSSKYSRRMLVHDSKSREGVLEDYKTSPDPVVLVSPSMGVGVDLPYDQCRFQVICKLPFPDSSDPQRVAQAQDPRGKKLAMYDTATNIVQMYGRAVRAMDDRGVTYLLDSNWKWLRPALKNLWPTYFTEAIKNF